MQKAEKQPLDQVVEEQNKQAAGKAQNELALVEAALYVAGRPLDLNELCQILRTRSKNKVRKLAQTLLNEYAVRNTALEILELKDERYVLQLKSDFTPHVKKLVNRPLLSIGPLKTLSYIAYRQPVSLRRVIEVRGNHAYGHVKMLKEMGLVGSERSGRSSILKTTDYFADYFALSHDTVVMKRELKHVFENVPRQEGSSAQNG